MRRKNTNKHIYKRRLNKNKNKTGRYKTNIKIKQRAGAGQVRRRTARTGLRSAASLSLFRGQANAFKYGHNKVIMTILELLLSLECNNTGIIKLSGTLKTLLTDNGFTIPRSDILSSGKLKFIDKDLESYIKPIERMYYAKMLESTCEQAKLAENTKRQLIQELKTSELYVKHASFAVYFNNPTTVITHPIIIIIISFIILYVYLILLYSEEIFFTDRLNNGSKTEWLNGDKCGKILRPLLEDECDSTMFLFRYLNEAFIGKSNSKIRLNIVPHGIYNMGFPSPSRGGSSSMEVVTEETALNNVEDWLKNNPESGYTGNVPETILNAIKISLKKANIVKEEWVNTMNEINETGDLRKIIDDMVAEFEETKKRITSLATQDKKAVEYFSPTISEFNKLAYLHTIISELMDADPQHTDIDKLVKKVNLVIKLTQKYELFVIKSMITDEKLKSSEECGKILVAIEEEMKNIIQEKIEGERIQLESTELPPPSPNNELKNLGIMELAVAQQLIKNHEDYQNGEFNKYVDNIFNGSVLLKEEINVSLLPGVDIHIFNSILEQIETFKKSGEQPHESHHHGGATQQAPRSRRGPGRRQELSGIAEYDVKALNITICNNNDEPNNIETIIPIIGPSASGKTYWTTLLMMTLYDNNILIEGLYSKLVNTQDQKPRLYGVISIDGGIVRALSIIGSAIVKNILWMNYPGLKNYSGKGFRMKPIFDSDSFKKKLVKNLANRFNKSGSKLSYCMPETSVINLRQIFFSKFPSLLSSLFYKETMNFFFNTIGLSQEISEAPTIFPLIIWVYQCKTGGTKCKLLNKHRKTDMMCVGCTVSGETRESEEGKKYSNKSWGIANNIADKLVSETMKLGRAEGEKYAIFKIHNTGGGGGYPVIKTFKTDGLSTLVDNSVSEIVKRTQGNIYYDKSIKLSPRTEWQGVQLISPLSTHPTSDQIITLSEEEARREIFIETLSKTRNLDKLVHDEFDRRRGFRTPHLRDEGPLGVAYTEYR